MPIHNYASHLREYDEKLRTSFLSNIPRRANTEDDIHALLTMLIPLCTGNRNTESAPMNDENAIAPRVPLLHSVHCFAKQKTIPPGKPDDANTKKLN